MGLVFSGWLFIPEKFWTVVAAWVIFSIMTSSVYIFNDIVDVEADRKHPFKKFRPIATGNLPIPLALFVSLSGVLISLVLGGMLSYFLFFTMILYLLLQVIYTNYLKTQPIIDVMAIALGFILRVYGGAFIIGAHINVWSLLCIISFALFLAIGKRRSELTFFAGKNGNQKSTGQIPGKIAGFIHGNVCQHDLVNLRFIYLYVSGI